MVPDQDPSRGSERRGCSPDSPLQSLFESQELIRQVVEGALEGLYIQIDGLFRYLNPAALAMFGAGYAEQLLGQPFMERVHPDYRAAVSERVRIIREERKPAPCLEEQYLRLDGAPFDVEVTAVAFTHEGQTGAFVFFRDVTRRKQAEAERENLLRSLNARLREIGHLRTLIDQSKDGMFICDPSLRITECNQVLTAMLGYTPEEIRRLHIWDLEAARTREQILAMEQDLRNGSLLFETRFRRKDGSVFDAEVSVSAGLGEHTLGLAVVRDISARKASEAALKASQLQLADAMDLAQLASWEYDVATGLFTFNDRFYGMYGTTAAREGGYRMSAAAYARELLHPDDAGSVEREIAKAVNPATPHQSGLTEHRIVRRDGEVRHAVVRWMATRDAGGRTIRVHGALQDITERKRAEENLRDVAEQLRLTFYQAPVGIAVATFEGRYVQVNAAFCRFLGYMEEELIGQRLKDYANPEYPLVDWDDVHRRLFAGEIATFSGDKCYRRRDGAAIWGHVTVQVVRDAAQRPLYLLGVVEDITERKRAEAELAESQLKLTALFESTSDLIWVVDPARFAYTAFNERVREYHAAAGVALRAGMTAQDVFSPEQADTWHGYYGRALREGNFEVRLELPPRETVIMASFHVLKQGGEVLGIMVFGKDITAREQGEKQQAALTEQLQQAQKLESIGRLAGGVAHDFNNLLTVIKGYSELAIGQLYEGDPLRGPLTEILNAGDRAAELTQQLLTFSRKQVTAPRPTNVNDLIADLRNMLQRLIGEDVALDTVLDPSLGSVLVDRAQFVQIVMNLAVNARDAMPAGGRLAIHTANTVLDEGHYPEAQPGSYVLVQVSDTGAGMDDDVRQHIFEPFFTTKAEGKGTGLGLSMVYGAVRQCGGWISVHSRRGAGTTFKIYLPRTDESAAPDTPRQLPSGALTGSETILVVEDRDEVRGFVVQVLKKYGYRVLEASNGEEALASFARHPGPIHLLLTDVVMPQMTGPQLVEGLRPAHPRMRVLYMSGYAREDAVRRGVLMAEAAYISKPFAPEALAAKVREVLRPAPPGKTRILVVDDEEAVRNLLRLMLTDAGYEVSPAGSVDEALRIARSGDFDLLLTDLTMPDRHGMDLIRDLRGQSAHLKIIAMSGAFGGDLLRTAELLGADATISKPVSRDRLLEAVRGLL